jgi:hypothetical protein
MLCILLVTFLFASPTRRALSLERGPTASREDYVELYTDDRQRIPQATVKKPRVLGVSTRLHQEEDEYSTGIAKQPLNC